MATLISHDSCHPPFAHSLLMYLIDERNFQEWSRVQERWTRCPEAWKARIKCLCLHLYPCFRCIHKLSREKRKLYYFEQIVYGSPQALFYRSHDVTPWTRICPGLWSATQMCYTLLALIQPPSRRKHIASSFKHWLEPNTYSALSVCGLCVHGLNQSHIGGRGNISWKSIYIFTKDIQTFCPWHLSLNHLVWQLFTRLRSYESSGGNLESMEERVSYM